MKGTEKQIAWAEDIRARLNSILNETMDRINAEAAAHPEQADKAEQARVMVSGMAEKINGFDGYAGDLIDVFAEARNFRGIQACLRLGDVNHIFH